jgi:hypothetical protein
MFDRDAGVVTLTNVTVVRELIVDIDDMARRFVYAAVGGRTTHHNASMQVFAEGEGSSRLVWITDVLPNEVAGPIGALVDQGAGVIKQRLSTTRFQGCRLTNPMQCIAQKASSC